LLTRTSAPRTWPARPTAPTPCCRQWLLALHVRRTFFEKLAATLSLARSGLYCKHTCAARPAESPPCAPAALAAALATYQAMHWAGGCLCCTGRRSAMLAAVVWSADLFWMLTSAVPGCMPPCVLRSSLAAALPPAPIWPLLRWWTASSRCCAPESQADIFPNRPQSAPQACSARPASCAG